MSFNIAGPIFSPVEVNTFLFLAFGVIALPLLWLLFVYGRSKSKNRKVWLMCAISYALCIAATTFIVVYRINTTTQREASKILHIASFQTYQTTYLPRGLALTGSSNESNDSIIMYYTYMKHGVELEISQNPSSKLVNASCAVLSTEASDCINVTLSDGGRAVYYKLHNYEYYVTNKPGNQITVTIKNEGEQHGTVTEEQMIRLLNGLRPINK